MAYETKIGRIETGLGPVENMAPSQNVGTIAMTSRVKMTPEVTRQRDGRGKIKSKVSDPKTITIQPYWKSESSKDMIARLPTNILRHLAEFLGPDDLDEKFSRLNRRCAVIATDEALWEKQFFNKYPITDLVDVLEGEQPLAERRSKGRVQIGRLKGTKQLVALRTVSLETTNAGKDDGVPTSCLRELSLWRELDHPSLLRHYGGVISGSTLTVVSEYGGKSLLLFLAHAAANGPEITADTVKSFLWQMFAAVDSLHRRVARAPHIERSRVRLSDLTASRAIDFPLGCYTPEDPKERDRSFREQRRLYTRAPELLLRQPVYGCEVDVWSLGCLFLEVALGVPPFRAETEIGLILCILQLCGTPDLMCWDRLGSSGSVMLQLPEWEPIDFRLIAMCLKDPDLQPLGIHAPPLQKYREREDTLNLLWSFGSKCGIAALHLLERLLVIPGCLRVSTAEALQYPYFASEAPDLDPQVLNWVHSLGDPPVLDPAGCPLSPVLSHLHRLLADERVRLLSAKDIDPCEDVGSAAFWSAIAAMEDRSIRVPERYSLVSSMTFDYEAELETRRQATLDAAEHRDGEDNAIPRDNVPLDGYSLATPDPVTTGLSGADLISLTPVPRRSRHLERRRRESATPTEIDPAELANIPSRCDDGGSDIDQAVEDLNVSSDATRLVERQSGAEATIHRTRTIGRTRQVHARRRRTSENDEPLDTGDDRSEDLMQHTQMNMDDTTARRMSRRVRVRGTMHDRTNSEPEDQAGNERDLLERSEFDCDVDLDLRGPREVRTTLSPISAERKQRIALSQSPVNSTKLHRREDKTMVFSPTTSAAFQTWFAVTEPFTPSRPRRLTNRCSATNWLRQQSKSSLSQTLCPRREHIDKLPLSVLPRVSPRSRMDIANYLLGIQPEFLLKPQTIHLAMGIFDRYVSFLVGYPSEFTAFEFVPIALACLKVADIFNETSKEYYKQDNLAEYCDFAKSPSHLLDALTDAKGRKLSEVPITASDLATEEKKILNKLQFEILVPTVMWFVDCYLSIARLLHATYLYLADLSLYSHKLLVHRPALQAQVILLFAIVSLFRPRVPGSDIVLHPTDPQYYQAIKHLMRHFSERKNTICETSNVWDVLDCLAMLRDLLLNGRRFFEAVGLRSVERLHPRIIRKPVPSPTIPTSFLQFILPEHERAALMSVMSNT